MFAVNTPLELSQVWRTPVVATVGAGLVVVLAIWFVRRGISLWVQANRSWNYVLSGLLLVATATAGVMLDLVDVSEALEGRFQEGFRWQASTLGVSAVLWFFAWFFQTYRNDSLRRTLRELALAKRVLGAHEERLRAIREIVSAKANRVREAAQQSEITQSRPGVGQVRDRLDAKQQFAINWSALFKRIQNELKLAPGQQLRIALYLPQDGNRRLAVVESRDEKGQVDVIQTPNGKYTDQFRLDRLTPGCLATYAAMYGGLWAIPNTDDMDEREQAIFELWDDRQRAEIKSIVAWGCKQCDTPPHPVITVDCNAQGAFGGDRYPEEILRPDMEEFGTRLLFERDMLQFLG